MVSLYLALVLVGWISIYSAIYDENHQSIFDMSQGYGKQMVWIVTALFLALVIILTDFKFFSAFAFPIYFFMILILIAVLIFGSTISGSKSWFQIGSVSLQPAEFAKFATNLAIAKYLSTLNVNFKQFKSVGKMLIILLLPSLLIFLQNDTGSAIVYVAFIFVFYREGMPGAILIIGLISVVLFIMTLLLNPVAVIITLFVICILLVFFMKRNLQNLVILFGMFLIMSAFILSVNYAFDNALEQHHRTRINVLLGIETDLKGAGYNVNQSLIAIGSGGLTGKGFLNGTQTKYNFVPEQSTDFIFCTVGEEWGFAGSIVIVGLFIALLIRIIIVAERQRSNFARIYGYGVASILFFHFAVNIAMTLGLFPVIGIPLPFVSYGGSSLWAFTILLFIFIKLDSYRLNA
jgi:rod shape determining protein RodA